MPDELDMPAETPASPEVNQEAFASGGEPEGAPVPAPPAAAAPPEVQSPGVRELLGSLGYALPEGVGDDYSALVHLAQRAQQAQQLEVQQRQADLYAQLGRQLAPQAPQIQQYLQGQQQPQQRKSYEPPPYNPLWERLLVVDEGTGRFVGRHQSVPQSIIDSANDYAEWLTNFQRNPMPVFQAFYDDRSAAAQQQVQQAVREGIAQYERQNAVQSILARNAAWAYERDAEGQFVADPLKGGYKVSPLGQQYVSLVNRGRQLGIQDPVALNEFAVTALRPEIAAALAPAEATSEPPARVAAGRQDRALPASRPRSNPLQSLSRQQRAETPGSTEPDGRRRTLREMFRENFDAEGIQDSHLMAAEFGN